MYQPPPLRARSAFDDKKVLVIDPKKPTRNARATVFRSHGIGVDATDSLQAARTLSRTKPYHWILLDAQGHLPGDARDFYIEISHASPRKRVVFLIGEAVPKDLTRIRVSRWRIYSPLRVAAKPIWETCDSTLEELGFERLARPYESLPLRIHGPH
jgi:CheY-like chemotaxis protein